MCDRQIANIDISKETMKAWARTMCIISRSPAWRHFWPPYAATSPRTVLSDAFPHSGQIELQLDDHRYSVEAPLLS